MRACTKPVVLFYNKRLTIYLHILCFKTLVHALQRICISSGADIPENDIGNAVGRVSLNFPGAFTFDIDIGERDIANGTIWLFTASLQVKELLPWVYTNNRSAPA